MSLDVRLHVGWWHQPHGMAERLELTRPMMRGSARLDPNKAWLQSLEKRQNVAALQLPADGDLAGSIDAMNLKNRFGDVETNRRDCLHLGSSESWGLNSAHIDGTSVPVEEPSTAS